MQISRIRLSHMNLKASANEDPVSVGAATALVLRQAPANSARKTMRANVLHALMGYAIAVRNAASGSIFEAQCGSRNVDPIARKRPYCSWLSSVTLPTYSERALTSSC